MRYTVINIDLQQDNLVYRYEDVSDNYSEEELSNKNAFFKWNVGDNYQWAEESIYEDAGLFVLVFYENHPFFNCARLVPTNPGAGESYTPLELVEDWFYDNVLDKV